MSTVEDEIQFLTREDIVLQMITAWQAVIPDAWLEDDGNVRLLFETFAGVAESVFLAAQILSEDMFVKTANTSALERWGDQYGEYSKVGSRAFGTLKFAGIGGTYIPIETSAFYDPLTGENVLFFETVEDGTIPNPGSPNAPIASVGSAGALTGLYEYAVSFLTVEGETKIGVVSNAVTVSSQRIALSNVPIGGPGTTARRIYRSKAGAAFQKVADIADNTTNVYTDNIADGSLGANPPDQSTAEQITLDAESAATGTDYNLVVGAITNLGDVPDDLTSVVNEDPFTNGTDPESEERFRGRLLNAVRSPGTGSDSDLKTWAEAIEGVDQATVYANDDMGTPLNGHSTVRISGINGSIPPAPVVTAVQQDLDAKDMANITIHVGTFTALPTVVTVDATPDVGYSLGDISDSVKQGVVDYVQSLSVGETLRVSGIVDAVFGLPGVADVVVTTPATNQATGAVQKRTISVGDVTVT